MNDRVLIEVVKPVDKDKWEQMLAALGGSIKHSTGWAAFHQKVCNRTPLFITGKVDLQENCVPDAICVCFVEQSSLPILSSLSQSVFLESFPVIRNNNLELFELFMQALEEYFAKQSFRLISIDSSQSPLSFQHISAEDYKKIDRWEFILDSSAPEDQLWKKLKESHRRKIKSVLKMEPDKISIRQSKDLNDLLKLKDLQKVSSSHAESRGHGYSISNDEYYESIKQLLLDRGLAKLYLAEYKGEVVSGALITIFNNQGYYMYGGSSEDGFQMSSSYFLFWEIILDLKKMSIKVFDFGGVPKEGEQPESHAHGLYRFKRGFGTDLILCSSGSKVLHNMKNRFYNLIQS